jgi:DNA-binding MarR family transcriptional regulator
MLKTLEGKGFIERARSSLDTRAKRVAVNPSGFKALRAFSE